MSDKPYFSILTLTFASEGDLRIWRDKVEMFSSEKAVAYLKEHGQKSLTIIETRENDTITVSYTHLTLPTILLV